MFPRHFSKTLTAFATLLGLLNAEQKPNILFIAIDDLRPSLSAYGGPVQTPAMDSIAEAGATFLNAHCQQAVCGPSRASIMTGKYPDTLKVWDLKTKIRDISPDVVTLPQHFKAHGYFSTGVGKIYDPRSVDKGADSASWSEPFAHTWNLEYNSETGKPKAHYHNPRTVALHEEAEAAGLKGWNPINQFLFKKEAWDAVEAENVPDDAYDDGAIARHAVKRLEDLVDQAQPFFLAVGL